MHYGTCEDEQIGGDAEAAAREGGVEAANEEGHGDSVPAGVEKK